MTTKSAEDALLVRAAIVGAATGFTLVALAYGLSRALIDRLRR